MSSDVGDFWAQKSGYGDAIGAVFHLYQLGIPPERL
jgi:hypothetical protein